MNLKFLTDEQLVKDLKGFVKQERTLLTEILYHLKELDSRKLFSSLGYKSLYEYACTELQYSNDQAYRRIQAMRLLKEIPEISNQINSGTLSLSNISQAQRYFNESKTTNKVAKIEVLKQLENKSVREAQKQLLSLAVEKPLPLETKKQITPTQVNVNFIMSENLEEKLEQIKSLLGPKGINISLAELVETMASLSLEKLKEQRFGKNRINQNSNTAWIHNKNSQNFHDFLDVKKETQKQTSNSLKQQSASTNSAPSIKSIHIKSNNSRYIARKIKYQIWHRDQGKCTQCASTRNLNFDHIQPYALGGESNLENLRLLCFHCNQRSKIEARL